MAECGFFFFSLSFLALLILKTSSVSNKIVI